MDKRNPKTGAPRGTGGTGGTGGRAPAPAPDKKYVRGAEDLCVNVPIDNVVFLAMVIFMEGLPEGSFGISFKHLRRPLSFKHEAQKYTLLLLPPDGGSGDGVTGEYTEIRTGRVCTVQVMLRMAQPDRSQGYGAAGAARAALVVIRKGRDCDAPSPTGCLVLELAPYDPLWRKCVRKVLALGIKILRLVKRGPP